MLCILLETETAINKIRPEFCGEVPITLAIKEDLGMHLPQDVVVANHAQVRPRALRNHALDRGSNVIPCQPEVKIVHPVEGASLQGPTR